MRHAEGVAPVRCIRLLGFRGEWIRARAGQGASLSSTNLNGQKKCGEPTAKNAERVCAVELKPRRRRHGMRKPNH